MASVGGGKLFAATVVFIFLSLCFLTMMPRASARPAAPEIIHEWSPSNRVGDWVWMPVSGVGFRGFVNSDIRDSNGDGKLSACDYVTIVWETYKDKPLDPHLKAEYHVEWAKYVSNPKDPLYGGWHIKFQST